MKTLKLIPNTPEWLAHRRRHNNASEASIIMGCSPYVKRDELLRMKHTGTDQEFSDWFQANVLDNGHAVEAEARPIAEDIVGDDLYPLIATDDDGWLGVSFDGITLPQDVIWECKQWSERKAVDVRQGRVPECDYWQVIQQLMVSKASRALYMLTDGTSQNTLYCWVYPDEDAFAKLREGWKVFDQDLAEYRLQEAPVVLSGSAPDQLPALRIEVTGMVTFSNLREFRDHALAVIGAINTDLETDQDFADAEQTVKWCGDVEERLEAAKQHALSQTSSIDELFRTIDAIKEEARKTRLSLDKRVKERKKEIRDQIAAAANQAFKDHVARINDTLDGVTMPYVAMDVGSAMKGKRTVSTLQSAANDTLAAAKIEANQIADKIRYNLVTFKEFAEGKEFLFADLQQLVLKESDDFKAAIRVRVQEHEEAEQKRLKAEQEAQQKAQELEARQTQKQQVVEQAAQEILDERDTAAKPAPQVNQQPIRVSLEDEIAGFLFDHTDVTEDGAAAIAHLIVTDQIPGVDIVARKKAA